MTTNERKERFLSILSKVKREGIDKLIEWLENSSFFTDPASTKYHDAFEGGLCKHSLEVYDNYVKLIGTDYEDETAIIACLLHDVCKIGTYQKTDTGYTYKQTILPFGHGDKSVLMIREFIQLTTEEILMIRWHMGAYESKECWNDLGAAQSMYKSVLYIHFADMLSSKGFNL